MLILFRLILERLREKQRKEKEALKQKQKRESKSKKNGEDSIISLPKTSHYNEIYCWHEASGFNWQKYLEWSNSKAAPVNLFKQDAFPKPHR